MEEKRDLPDSYVEGRSTREYPTELGSQPFRPDDIALFKLDKTNGLKHHYVSRFEELRNEYIALMAEIAANERVWSSKFNFQPIPGQTYYLYTRESGEFLSIISPDEWSGRYELVGTYILKTDGRWEEINC